MCRKLICLIIFVLVIVTASVHADLAHHWTLDEDTNAGATTVSDSVGGKDGTINGASSSAGVFGNSLYFDGAGTVEVADFGTADLKSMTITFWMNPDVGYTSKGGYKRVISANDGWEVIMQPDSGLLGNNLYRKGGEYAQSTVAPSEGDWTHVAMTADLSPPGTGLMEIYLNGEFDASMENQVLDDWDGGTFLMGYRASGGGEHYEGFLDDVRIYNEVLSEIEIKAAMEGVVPTTIHVDPNSDLAAANESAKAGDTIEFAEGTYNITTQLTVKDGVTYKGAGPGLTIIDGGNTTRAFVAWGDRNATAGQVDANGVAVPNTTGPKDWVLEGLTIQNCVADADDRFSYAGVALDLLGNAQEDDSFADRDTDGSGGLNIDEADADNGSIRLPGLDGIEPSEDDDIHRFVEMDADGNGELSEAELDIAIAEKKEEFADKRDDGNVLVIENGVVGTIQNCEFLNNTTSLDVEAADGGVLIINGQTTVITIANCKFEGNTSTDKGGAILVGVEAEVTLKDCDFINNRTSEVGGDNHGGAILIWGQSKMTVNACRFEGNIANNGHGGALYASGESVVTITGCELKDNHCGLDGGAINLGGLSEGIVNDCMFADNYAASADGIKSDDLDGDGGHIKVQTDSESANTPGTTLIVNRCDFLGGKSEDDGGAIMSGAVGCVVRLDACWFEGNTAADDGTVLFTGNVNSNELTVTNCVFVNNISAGASDKMCHVKRNSKFINCTFSGNSQDDLALIQNTANIIDADGDGVDDEMADVTQVVNCIFINNVVGNGDDVLRSTNNDFTIAAKNCIFFGNTLQDGSDADNTQRPGEETGTILADPLLDALLVPGVASPAIDAGINPATVGVTITTDLSGNPRPQGAAFDVGAYEVSAAQ